MIGGTKRLTPHPNTPGNPGKNPCRKRWIRNSEKKYYRAGGKKEEQEDSRRGLKSDKKALGIR